jgi:hypothetical protein
MVSVVTTVAAHTFHHLEGVMIAMPIIQKAKTAKALDDAKFDKFVSGAPDAEKRLTKPKGAGKRPINLTMDPKLLARIDELASAQGLSRAAYITMGMHYVVSRGIFKE